MYETEGELATRVRELATALSEKEQDLHAVKAELAITTDESTEQKEPVSALAEQLMEARSCAWGLRRLLCLDTKAESGCGVDSGSVAINEAFAKEEEGFETEAESMEEAFVLSADVEAMGRSIGTNAVGVSIDGEVVDTERTDETIAKKKMGLETEAETMLECSNAVGGSIDVAAFDTDDETIVERMMGSERPDDVGDIASEEAGGVHSVDITNGEETEEHVKIGEVAYAVVSFDGELEAPRGRWSDDLCDDTKMIAETGPSDVHGADEKVGLDGSYGTDSGFGEIEAAGL